MSKQQKQRYILTSLGDEQLIVFARAHRQYIYNETELVGISKNGVKRLNKFFAEHQIIYTNIAGMCVKVTDYFTDN
jgi:hypothetical protein